jgi:ribosomal protein L21E
MRRRRSASLASSFPLHPSIANISLISFVILPASLLYLPTLAFFRTAGDRPLFLSRSVRAQVVAHMLPTLQHYVRCQSLQVVVDAAVRQRAFVVAYDCERSTAIGNLCEQHADELLGLQVMESDIAGAGLGLFTTRDRASHEYICGYVGTVVSKAEFDSLPNSYGVEISRGRVVSAMYSTDGFGRYANDAKGRSNNCWLLTEAKYGSQYGRPRFRGSGGCVCIVSKQEFEAGEELLVSYGSSYWTVNRNVK